MDGVVDVPQRDVGLLRDLLSRRGAGRDRFYDAPDILEAVGLGNLDRGQGALCHRPRGYHDRAGDRARILPFCRCREVFSGRGEGRGARPPPASGVATAEDDASRPGVFRGEQGRQCVFRAGGRVAAGERVVREEPRGVEIHEIHASERGHDVGRGRHAEARLDHAAAHEAEPAGLGRPTDGERREGTPRLRELEIDSIRGFGVGHALEIGEALHRLVRDHGRIDGGRDLRAAREIEGRARLLEALHREPARGEPFHEGEGLRRGEAGVRVEAEARVRHGARDRAEGREIVLHVAADLHLEAGEPLCAVLGREGGHAIDVADGDGDVRRHRGGAGAERAAEQHAEGEAREARHRVEEGRLGPGPRDRELACGLVERCGERREGGVEIEGAAGERSAHARERREHVRLVLVRDGGEGRGLPQALGGAAGRVLQRHAHEGVARGRHGPARDHERLQQRHAQRGDIPGTNTDARHARTLPHGYLEITAAQAAR